MAPASKGALLNIIIIITNGFVNKVFNYADT